jgi:hypothetical protein
MCSRHVAAFAVAALPRLFGRCSTGLLFLLLLCLGRVLRLTRSLCGACNSSGNSSISLHNAFIGSKHAGAAMGGARCLLACDAAASVSTHNSTGTSLAG